jgi:hypothetical protein
MRCARLPVPQFADKMRFTERYCGSSLCETPPEEGYYWLLGVVVGDGAAAGGGCSLKANMRNFQAPPFDVPEDWRFGFGAERSATAGRNVSGEGNASSLRLWSLCLWYRIPVIINGFSVH